MCDIIKAFLKGGGGGGGGGGGVTLFVVVKLDFNITVGQ